MRQKFTFNLSNFYKKNIIYFSKNLRGILKKKKLKENKIKALDYGCGNCYLHNFLRFKSLYLFDPNLDRYELKLKKKIRKFNTFNKLKNNKVKFDLIIINSVIQYINPKNLRIVIKHLLNKTKKNGIVIISDIPDRPRWLEILSFKNLIITINLFSYFGYSKNYLKLDYYFYKKKIIKLMLRKKKCRFEFIRNLNFIKTRYSIIISK
tara:strand:+ start:2974 stop:3594 length:621 start_codon:yes stop_codon:yes gene_type:complete